MRENVILYAFSGPDFIFANAIFPRGAVYVLTGLEAVGDIPNFMALRETIRSYAALCVRSSFEHFLKYGFFRTANMQDPGSDCEFKGTIPLLLVMLARSGAKIKSIEHVEIDINGKVELRAFGNDVKGVRIKFSSKQGVDALVYYFRTDLSDAAISGSGFLSFCASLGRFSSLIKAASYLLHDSSYAKIRQCILENSAIIVQDDSGIPRKYFNALEWDLVPFGRYVEPSRPFQRFSQPDMRKLFMESRPQPILFGLGYHWRAEEAGVLVAYRK